MTTEQLLELIEKVQVVECNDPQLIVLVCPKIMTETHRNEIKKEWFDMVKGTKLDGVKVAILMGGMDIKIIDMKQS